MHQSLRFSGSSNRYYQRIVGTGLTGAFMSSNIVALGFATQSDAFACFGPEISPSATFQITNCVGYGYALGIGLGLRLGLVLGLGLTLPKTSTLTINRNPHNSLFEESNHGRTGEMSEPYNSYGGGATWRVSTFVIPLIK